MAKSDSIKNLVIVESPAKAKTIEKFLGSDFLVKSSYGHIRDLPKDDSAIDIKNGYAPHYIVPPDKKNVVSELKKSALAASQVWLASDEDREAELKRLAELSDEAFAATEAAYERLPKSAKADKDKEEKPADSDQGQGDEHPDVRLAHEVPLPVRRSRPMTLWPGTVRAASAPSRTVS